MPSYSSPDQFQQKSFRIKHDDDKLFTRLLSKENSKPNNSSIRVYYGDDDVSSGVPFIWETRPGTPKLQFHENSIIIRPLTPPPSFYTNSTNTKKKKKSKSKLFLNAFLRRMNIPKKHKYSSSLTISLSSWSPSSSSSSSFRHDSMITPSYNVERRRRFLSWGGDETAAVIGKKNGKRFRSGYLSSVYFVKKAFLSIVGHRSA